MKMLVLFFLQFYVERKTGKRLRSLVSVERYLKQSGNRKDHHQQLVLLQQHHRVPSKDFNLPDGWIVEEKHRRNSCRIDRVHYTTHICVSLVCLLYLNRYCCLCAQFYIEPGTGKKFRSLPAVETYLNGTADSVDSEQLSVSFNIIQRFCENRWFVPV